MGYVEFGGWDMGTWRMGYVESGGWGMANLEDSIGGIRRMGYGESGGCDTENLKDDIWRVLRGFEKNPTLPVPPKFEHVTFFV